ASTIVESPLRNRLRISYTMSSRTSGQLGPNASISPRMVGEVERSGGRTSPPPGSSLAGGSCGRPSSQPRMRSYSTNTAPNSNTPVSRSRIRRGVIRITPSRSSRFQVPGSKLRRRVFLTWNLEPGTWNSHAEPLDESVPPALQLQQPLDRVPDGPVPARWRRDVVCRGPHLGAGIGDRHRQPAPEQDRQVRQ